MEASELSHPSRQTQQFPRQEVMNICTGASAKLGAPEIVLLAMHRKPWCHSYSDPRSSSVWWMREGVGSISDFHSDCQWWLWNGGLHGPRANFLEPAKSLLWIGAVSWQVWVTVLGPSSLSEEKLNPKLPESYCSAYVLSKSCPRVTPSATLASKASLFLKLVWLHALPLCNVALLWVRPVTPGSRSPQCESHRVLVQVLGQMLSTHCFATGLNHPLSPRVLELIGGGCALPHDFITSWPGVASVVLAISDLSSAGY